MLRCIKVVSRNKVSDIITFLSKPIFFASMEQLELNTILYGLHLAVSRGWGSIVLESDLRVVIEVISKRWKKKKHRREGADSV